MTVIQLINEVRLLVGLNTIKTLGADKAARVALRMLNEVISEMASAGDWHELLASANVTAVVSTREYGVGVKHPIHHIHEIAISGRAQSLYPIELSKYTRYSRAGGSGTPNFFTIKGVDNQGNPKFAVHPQPASADDGNFFGVLYFRKPKLMLTCDADVEIEFPANVVMNGLYAKVLEEEAGGIVTRESMMAYQTYQQQLQEALNRYNADSGRGTDVQFVPTGTR